MIAENETRTPTATPNGKQGGARALAVKVKIASALKASRGMSRAERWRMFAEERIEQLKDYTGLDLLQECAAVEGVTPAELIVDRLARERCNGAVVEERPAEYFCPKFRAYEDTEYERGTVRSRNAHERRVVSNMVWSFTNVNGLTPDLEKRYGRCFVRRFYRKGDNYLGAAFRRFVLDALERIEGGKEVAK